MLLRYTQSVWTQTAQSALCNRHHSLEQQLCRWLLLSLDRVDGSQIRMTQQLIADMLGVRREGVVLAAKKLQRRGWISYSRGVITVLNRTALEGHVCECYQAVNAEYRRLLGGLRGSPSAAR
jgi:DNA-binding MarR family transcriptional regulator